MLSAPWPTGPGSSPAENGASRCPAAPTWRLHGADPDPDRGSVTADRPAGGVWPGAGDPARRRPRPRAGTGQRHPLRARGRRLDRQHHHRRSPGTLAAGRYRVGQHLRRRLAGDAFRGHEGLRSRPRPFAARARRLHAAEDDVDLPRVTRVAFIGLGHMGGHMCRNVITAGFDVCAFDLDAGALRRARETGARPAGSAAQAAAGADMLVTSLPGPPQVEQVLTGSGGAIAALAPGALVIEMSTSSLEVGRRAQAAARARGVEMIDAPVAGQTIRAESGTRAISAGGDSAAFPRALPMLEAIGDPQQIFHLGPHGSGYAVKLLLNLTWFVHAVATAEAMAVGVKVGVDIDKLHTALVNSPANSNFLEHDVRSVLDSGDYDEGFAMKLVTKDLGLAVDLARDVGVPVELAALVEQIHLRARSRYGDHAGGMRAMRLYEELAEVELRWHTSS